jgi:hypothetical protein
MGPIPRRWTTLKSCRLTHESGGPILATGPHGLVFVRGVVKQGWESTILGRRHT